MPLPGTRIIPAGWSRHHAAALPTSFNAAVSVGVRTGTAYDAETDTTSATWSSDWAGGARVQRLHGEGPVDLAGQTLTGQPYLVELDFDAPAFGRGVRVLVIEAINDTSLVDVALYVVAAPMGSERFTRSLLCSDAAKDAA